MQYCNEIIVKIVVFFQNDPSTYKYFFLSLAEVYYVCIYKFHLWEFLANYSSDPIILVKSAQK